MTSLVATENWIVTETRPEASFVVDAVSAPLLRVRRVVRPIATCPKGHMLPPLTADEAVVRHFEGTAGPTIGCEACGKNYQLALGKWPDKFPEPARTVR